MSVRRTVQKGASDLSFILGVGLMYTGGAALLVMAAIGTVAIDIVLLAYAEKNHNSFLTGYILGSMFFGPRIDPVPLFVVSPFTSAIAVGLSFALGVGEIGLAILAGWAVATVVLTIGLGFMALSKALEPSEVQKPRQSASVKQNELEEYTPGSGMVMA